jgi:hypothetical protein
MNTPGDEVAAVDSGADPVVGSGRDSEVLALQKRAAAMRVGGAGYQAIADRLGYKTASGAHQAVQAGFVHEFSDETSEVRRLELERLDRLLLGLWPAASTGDIKAVNAVLKVMDRRAKYLRLDVGEEQPGGGGVRPIDALRERRESRQRRARTGSTASTDI